MVLINMVWRFAERVGAQGVKLLVEIILARLLLPDDYGLIALVTVFITILNVFVNSGFGNALIQKKDADDLDFSSVFWFNIVWCFFLYIILFSTAPYIAAYYERQELVPVIRVLGIQVIVSGIKNVQQAYISRTFQFRRFFFATIGGTLGAAGIGIWMAFQGYGVWALVVQQLFNVLMDTVILWITVRWRPKWQFSFSRLVILFSYGWKLLVSALIDTAYTEICQLIIGKFYTPGDLAYYNRGRQFPALIVGNVNNTIDSVLLPTMSKEQDNAERIKSMTRRAIKTSTYIMAPFLMGLAFMADTVVKAVLTEKWLECIPFLRIFCIVFMFYPIHTANLNAIKAMGRSDLFLKLEIIKKIIGMVLLLSAMWFGVIAMAYSMLVSSIIGQIINSWPNHKLLHYGYLEQLKDILPSILLAVSMGVCVGLVGMLVLPLGFKVFAQIMLGVAVYVIESRVFNLDSFNYLRKMLKSMLKEHYKGL